MKRSSNLSKTSQLITGRCGHNTQMWMGVIVNIRDQLVFGFGQGLEHIKYFNPIVWVADGKTGTEVNLAIFSILSGEAAQTQDPSFQSNTTPYPYNCS